MGKHSEDKKIKMKKKKKHIGGKIFLIILILLIAGGIYLAVQADKLGRWMVGTNGSVYGT